MAHFFFDTTAHTPAVDPAVSATGELGAVVQRVGLPANRALVAVVLGAKDRLLGGRFVGEEKRVRSKPETTCKVCNCLYVALSSSLFEQEKNAHFPPT